jgi:arsenate reductase
VHPPGARYSERGGRTLKKENHPPFTIYFKVLCLKFYFYPSCSTCQSALKYLKEKEKSFDLLDISKSPPSKAELKQMLAYQEGKIRSLFNTSGMQYRELDMKNKLPGMSEYEALVLLSKNGMLVKRPFLIGKDFGLLGFKKDFWDVVLL